MEALTERLRWSKRSTQEGRRPTMTLFMSFRIQMCRPPWTVLLPVTKLRSLKHRTNEIWICRGYTKSRLNKTSLAPLSRCEQAYSIMLHRLPPRTSAARALAPRYKLTTCLTPLGKIARPNRRSRTLSIKTARIWIFFRSLAPSQPKSSKCAVLSRPKGNHLWLLRTIVTPTYLTLRCRRSNKIPYLSLARRPQASTNARIWTQIWRNRSFQIRLRCRQALTIVALLGQESSQQWIHLWSAPLLNRTSFWARSTSSQKNVTWAMPVESIEIQGSMMISLWRWHNASTAGRTWLKACITQLRSLKMTPLP